MNRSQSIQSDTESREARFLEVLSRYDAVVRRVCFMYSDFFVIMELVGDEFIVVDYVNVLKSKIFTRLLGYSIF